MDSIEIGDAEAMIRLLARLADPAVNLPLEERKRAIVSGIADLIQADTWVWTVGRANLALPGLDLSEHTVADYLKGIYRKLGVNSRAELLAKFIPAGV